MSKCNNLSVLSAGYGRSHTNVIAGTLMCGIAGVVNAAELSEWDLKSLQKAMSAMRHRGPDGDGKYIDPGAGTYGATKVMLGMRRLSIIDLLGGWQPLFNEDKSLVVVANGEIYNHVELRVDLEKQGHVFYTGSDCEVLVHLYEEYGLDFVHKLRGMYSFALWDSQRRRLVLVRDRMGEKPLYLFCTHDSIWFGSELKALLATGRVPFDLDPAGINDYLHFGWIPEPRTAVAGVSTLPAGSLMIVDVDPWKVTQRRYWRVEDVPEICGNAVEAVRSELDDIGKMIVRSDVPIGVALSGGFDSSLVAALGARSARDQIQAFTIGYESSPGQDESSLAANFARRLGMRHSRIELSVDRMVADFPKLAFDRDEPISDMAGYGYYALSRASKEAGCPVLLQGHGADELLWGYPWAVEAVEQNMRKAEGNPMGRLEALWRQRPRNGSRPQLARFAYLMGGLLAGWRTLSPALYSGVSDTIAYDLTDPFQIGAHSAHDTYTKSFRNRINDCAANPRDFFRSVEQDLRPDIRMISLLCRGYLLQNGLVQGDRLSMAHSVEARLPLVDYRLVEVLTGCQKSKPTYRGKPKGILHAAASDLVPTDVAARPKRGFNPPVAIWTTALKAAYGRTLANGALIEAGLLDVRAAHRLASSSSRFGVNNDLFIKYLVLEYWYRGMHETCRSATT